MFTAGLLNRTAACAAALAEAERLGASITFLSAQGPTGQSFSLEDTAVCGAGRNGGARGGARAR
ncbi:MAG: hypothetical protein U0531_15510 [Dehalococcoidia bacterium]